MRRRRSAGKEGAALIESCLVIIMLCFLLFGMLQLSYLIAARDVISFASVGVARSAAVGSDEFMLWKTTRVLTIPTAGPMMTPDLAAGTQVYGNTMGDEWDYAVENTPGNEQYYSERFLIWFYLGAEWVAEARAILNYANWEQTTTRVQSPPPISPSDMTAPEAFVDSPLTVSQYVPLAMPFATAFFRQNMYPLWREGDYQYEVPHADIRSSTGIENHAAYYMQAQ